MAKTPPNPPDLDTTRTLPLPWNKQDPVKELEILNKLSEPREYCTYKRLELYCSLHRSVTANLALLAPDVRCTPKELRVMWPKLAPYFTKRGDRYVHTELEKQLRDVLAYQKERRESGAKGGHAKEAARKTEREAARAVKKTASDPNLPLIYKVSEKEFLAWREHHDAWPTREELFAVTVKTLTRLKLPQPDTEKIYDIIDSVFKRWQKAQLRAVTR
jgi:uncharacterized protein YdaU (DUF1376 family)